MKNQYKLVTAFFISLISTSLCANIKVTLDKADPSPIDSTEFPYSYLYESEKASIKGSKQEEGAKLFSISASPYYSRATKGTSVNNVKGEIGDIGGRWNLFAILDTSSTPTGKTFPTKLTSVSDSLIGSTTGCLIDDGASTTNGIPYVGSATPTELTTVAGLLSLQTDKEEFGFLTIPVNYRKYGIRFSGGGNLGGGFGFNVSTGVASISQSASFNNATTFPTTSTTNITNPFDTTSVATDANWVAALKCIDSKLVKDLDPTIANAMGLDLSNFNKTSIEDLHGEFSWRKAFQLDNEDENVLFMPFISIHGSIDLGETDNPDKPLSLPFGNNGHNSWGGAAGFTLDFDESLEIGAAAGITTFASRREDSMRMPNNIHQSGLYPFKTAAMINPGSTWYVSLLMNSYHFDDDLSFHFDYIYTNHNQDKIALIENDSAFKPDHLASKTPWNAHLANMGLNYDVSSGVQIGIAAQIPLKQRNAYRSTTVMVSITASH